MKNSILFTLALMLTLVSTAQESDWKIGFKVNPNMSWFKPDVKFIKSEGKNLRFGFSLMIDKHFTDNYAIGTGLNIFRTGGDLSYSRLSNESVNGVTKQVISTITRDYKIQYAEIPFTLKLRTNEIGYITYWGQFGLGLGLNISSKADQEIDYTKQSVTVDGVTTWETAVLETSTTENEDIKDDVSIFRPSLIIGGGIEYSLSGSTSVIAGITYNNGFMDSLKGKGVETDDRDEPIFNGVKPKEYDLKAFSNFIELNIGIVF